MADDPLSMKRCTKCGVDKPVCDFGVDRSAPGGLNRRCKVCHLAEGRAFRVANPQKERARRQAYRLANLEKERARRQAFYQANAERLKSRGKAYYLANTDAVKVRCKAYVLANTEIVSARKRAWCQANAERLKSRSKAYCLANADAAKVRSKAYYLANTEKAKAKNRDYGRANPAKVKVHKHRRRARLLSAPGNHTAVELIDLFTKQKGKCAYCFVSIAKGYHADHIQPLSKGGSNWISNIALACARCNQKKHARDPIEFMQSRGRLI